MLLIECPHCGPRAETEYAGCSEAHIARPDGGGLDMTDSGVGRVGLSGARTPKGVYLGTLEPCRGLSVAGSTACVTPSPTRSWRRIQGRREAAEDCRR